MISYLLPESLDADIEHLRQLIDQYKKGEIPAAELKAYRVPFGVYEQREPDTYMVRIRCAAGIITPEQLARVADIAIQYTKGKIHFTTRQEVQIHDVPIDSIISIISELQKVGLASRGGGGNTVRNIIVQEDAGVLSNEPFDVTPYAVALTSRLISEADSWTLPRKYKIAFSSNREDRGYATIADLGFIAKVAEGKRGFSVYVAGGMGARSEISYCLYDFVDDSQVYFIAKAVKNLFWKYGNRKNKHAARLRFLFKSLGEEEFLRRFNEELSEVTKSGVAPLKICEINYAVTKIDFAGTEKINENDFELWKQRFVSVQKQNAGNSVLIPVALGFMDSYKIKSLAEFVTPLGEAALRLTKNQNVIVRNVHSENLGDLFNFLTKKLQLMKRPLFFDSLLSCAGASTCQLGICLSRGLANAIIGSLADNAINVDLFPDARLHISGCPNSCGQHLMADLGFFGRAERKNGKLYPAYSVVAGAVIAEGETRFAEQVGIVSARDVPALVCDLFGSFARATTKYTSFSGYMQHEGLSMVKDLCVKYQDIPSYEDNTSYYYDWGSDEEFSLAKRGTGECSAGLFDLIDVDLKRVHDAKERILKSSSKEDKGVAVKDTIFYASRMLLITRGVEAQNALEVVNSFKEHFIKTGLVDASHNKVLDYIDNSSIELLSTKNEEAVEFANVVEALYIGMDTAFKFHKKENTNSSSNDLEDIESKHFKDLRGVTCPINFVKTKIALAKVPSGEVLEILLDDGPPIDNVPGSVRGEGHSVVSQDKIESYWKVAIKKK